jgi:hypothetical protein
MSNGRRSRGTDRSATATVQRIKGLAHATVFSQRNGSNVRVSPVEFFCFCLSNSRPLRPPLPRGRHQTGVLFMKKKKTKMGYPCRKSRRSRRVDMRRSYVRHADVSNAYLTGTYLMNRYCTSIAEKRHNISQFAPCSQGARRNEFRLTNARRGMIGLERAQSNCFRRLPACCSHKGSDH